MDAALLNAQAKAQIEAGPQVRFTIDGHRVSPATRGVAWYRLRYSEWGRENQFEGTIIVRRLDCPDRVSPEPMTECTVEGVTRRIIQVDADATGDTLFLSIGARRHRGGG
jgi:hypothetical protein